MLFGKSLKLLRKSRNLKQKELNIKCSTQTVSNWETGLFTPSEKHFIDICNKLKLNKMEQKELLCNYLFTIENRILNNLSKTHRSCPSPIQRNNLRSRS